MIITVGCTVAVDGKYTIVPASLDDLPQVLAGAPPTALYVAVAMVADPSAWTVISNALAERAPVIAVARDAAEIAAAPAIVDDVVVGTIDRELATARLDLAIRRCDARRAHNAEMIQRAETLSELGTFAAGVAHDVRNRLFGISATIEAFQSSTQSNPEIQPFLEVLDTELSRLQKDLIHLLDYGRASVVQLVPGRLRDAIQEAIATSQNVAEAANTRVEVRLVPDLPITFFDHRKLVRAFYNLFVNAIQHARDGHVVLTVERETRDGSDMIVCRMLDDGPGFPPGMLDRLFEPYVTRRAGGVGLGLAIVRRIVAAHGGRVSAENRPTGGAAVTITLPVVTRTTK